MMTVKERGMAHGADANAPAFVGDLVDQRGAFVAFDADEAEFDELVIVELALELLEKFGGESGFADLNDGIERLAESAEIGLLRAGKREVVHVGESSE